MSWTNPRTWVPGEKPTAAELNTHIRDNFKAIGDAWTAYTPTWAAATTNPTLGNGTLTGHYIQAGKLILFRISLTFGSTTTVGSGLYSFSLPVNANKFGHVTAGTGIAYDTSANTRAFALVRIPTTSTCDLWRVSTEAVMTHAVPFAWANGDVISLHGTYEAA